MAPAATGWEVRGRCGERRRSGGVSGGGSAGRFLRRWPPTRSPSSRAPCCATSLTSSTRSGRTPCGDGLALALCLARRPNSCSLFRPSKRQDQPPGLFFSSSPPPFARSCTPSPAAGAIGPELLNFGRMSKGPVPFISIGKRAKDLLYKDYNFDQKFSLSTTSNSGLGVTATGVKIDELFIGDIQTQHKSGRTTVDVKIDCDSKRIVPPVLNSFLDQDSRGHYYACEALYNIAKIYNLIKMTAKRSASDQHGSSDSRDEIIMYLHAPNTKHTISKSPRLTDIICISDDEGPDILKNTTNDSILPIVPKLEKNVDEPHPLPPTKKNKLSKKAPKKATGPLKKNSSFNHCHQTKKTSSSTTITEQGPSYAQLTQGYNNLCVFANNIRVTSNDVERIRQIVGTKQHQIPLYICKMNKTFIVPNDRMYFSVSFTDTYLKNYLDEPINFMPIKNIEKKITDHVRLKLGRDKRGTITTNWPRFVARSSIKLGDTCIFKYAKTKQSLDLQVYCL